MKIIKVETATSTSSVLSAMPEAEHGTVVAAHTQTAGRGQRGNSWESAPGKNLTFSLLLRPQTIPAARQFEISELVALAIAEVLSRHLPDAEVSIKWPNDIYVGNSKICGTLIENTLCDSRIERSIAGIGINVNQEKFLSDAPNPISMLNITGREFDTEGLLEEFVREIITRFDLYESAPDTEALTTLYRRHLWRKDGYHPYRDNLAAQDIMGRIADVAPNGLLTLETPSGERRTFAFKEVAAILAR